MDKMHFGSGQFAQLDELEQQILVLLAETGLKISKVSAVLHYHRKTIAYHIGCIMRKTGKDPLNVLDLAELLGYVQQRHEQWKWSQEHGVYCCTGCGRRETETLRYCACCGAEMKLEESLSG